MNADELSARMKQFAVDIIKICDVMPRKLSSQVTVKQQTGKPERNKK